MVRLTSETAPNSAENVVESSSLGFILGFNFRANRLYRAYFLAYMQFDVAHSLFNKYLVIHDCRAHFS